MDLLPINIKVVPPEREQLAPPHAGEHEAQPQRPPWLRRRLVRRRISSGVRTVISRSSPRGRSTYLAGLASRYPHWTACLHIVLRMPSTLPIVLGESSLAISVFTNSRIRATSISRRSRDPKNGRMCVASTLSRDACVEGFMRLTDTAP
jgi:hypothetical protein